MYLLHANLGFSSNDRPRIHLTGDFADFLDDRSDLLDAGRCHMNADLKHFRKNYDTSMREMFAAVSDFYAQYWGDFFHFALFDDDRQSWEDALERTHEAYIEDIRLSNAHKVIELACGRGGFCDYLAHHTQGQVLGVDISPTQLARARRFTRGNLRFRQQDIMHVEELGETFDAVVFMDAACYLPDKAKALAKIRCIMNPGSRLLLIDWCKQEGLHRTQEELVLHPFMQYCAVPGLETMASYKRHLTRAGFQILRMEDRTDRVRQNWERGYEQAVRGIRDLSLRDIARFARKGLRTGRRGLQLVKEQFPTAIYIKVGFDTGFLRYAYFLAEAM
jgi:cyclopropane fatty-acyl-phospholipid synthase-like methyltransferase